MFELEQNGVSDSLRNVLQDFLDKRKQKVVLNEQVSSWTSLTAGVPQGSILGLLLCLICIDDLSKTLSSNAKRCADGTSLFSVINDNNTSGAELNDNLSAIKNLAFQ